MKSCRLPTLLCQGVLVAAIAMVGPAVADRQDPSLAAQALGLPGTDPRPVEQAFVLPHTNPIIASDVSPSDRAPVNLQGMPGLMDMPTATPLPDGELQIGVSSFGGITRTALAFQITPRLTGAFRYNRIEDFQRAGFDTYYDRAFDVQYQVIPEGDLRPGLAIGLRDFGGTGIQAGEYVVASKGFALPRGKVTVSAGLGWGRLGSFEPIGTPFSAVRSDTTGLGGTLRIDDWFRGPAAPFAGLEWRMGERWRVKAEYSSDAYEEADESGVFDRASPFNFGVEYQATDTTRLGLYSMYGSEIGAMVSFGLNPRRSGNALVLAAPGPVVARPDRALRPDLWSPAWHGVSDRAAQIAPRVEDALGDQAIEVAGLDFPSATEARIRIRNGAYNETAMAIGRTARAMAASLPPSVETFHIVPDDDGVALSVVTIRRSDLEQLDGRPDRAVALAARTEIRAARDIAPITPRTGLFPRVEGGLRPYFTTSAFDPAQPLRADVGLAASGRVEFAPGLTLSGEARQKLFGNVGDTRASSSKLPPVRTNSRLYAQADGITLNRLTLAYAGALSPTLYGRVTGGYLERMFGGVSGEVLWKPVDSRFALGAEVNYAQQRDFDQGFGFQDYDIVTGHLSAYYDFGQGYLGQIDVGRYLAGDVGATIALDREFDNGWRVGAFATFTDVSAEDFGEGSFDKGIRLAIPVQSILGTPSTQALTQTIRPIQRDGGARLNVPGRLYDRVRSGHSNEVFADWGRVWR